MDLPKAADIDPVEMKFAVTNTVDYIIRTVYGDVKDVVDFKHALLELDPSGKFS